MSGLALLLLGVVVAFVLFRLLAKKPQAKSAPRGGNAQRVSQPASRARDSMITAVAGEGIGEAAQEPDPVPEALLGLQLLRVEEIDDAAKARVAALCETMAEPHPVQAQLVGGLDEPDELMEVVTSDAGLTARVLRTVNSAAFSLTSPISSVQHAITFLGVSFVKGLVAEAAVAANLPEGTPAQQDALARIWTSASCASAIAQMLGQEMSVDRPSVLATKALFTNLGDVAITMGVEEATDWYASGVGVVDRINRQQHTSGINSAIVGGALARHWQLPEEIAQAIESSFDLLVTSPGELKEEEDAASAALLYLATRIGDRVTYGGLRDIGEVNLDDEGETDLFHLRAHLEATGLGRVPKLLQEPALRRKANRLLATLSG